MKCPKCGKFIGKVKATINGLDEIMKVTGECKTDGLIDVTNSGDWAAWDFFLEELEGII